MSADQQFIPLSSLTTTLIKKEDIYQNKLLIPNEIKNTSFSPNDFEIYLCGTSTKCGLMIGNGKLIKQENNEIEEKNFYLENTWPYFIKFTRETIPITLQQFEYVKFISCGLQHLVVATNFSKCYLFGDYCYSDNDSITTIKENDFHFNYLLQFCYENNTLQKQLNCNITHLDSGEQFVILKDEFNRFWFSGKNEFGSGKDDLIYFNFLQLDGGQLERDLNNYLNKNLNRITKVIAGGRHAAVCVNDKIIYTIGNNYFNQLGIKSLPTKMEILRSGEDKKNRIPDFSFVKANWNENEDYLVQELACSGNATIVLTSKFFYYIFFYNNNYIKNNYYNNKLFIYCNLKECGKVFKTSQNEERLILVNNLNNEKILTLGNTWSEILLLSESKNIFTVGDYNCTASIMNDINNTINNTINNDNHNNKNKQFKLFNGTGDDFNSGGCFGMFFENEVKIFKDLEMIRIRTNELPIVQVKNSVEIILIFCLKESNVMQSKLFKMNGLFDIEFLW